jgi:hypothetical protein
MIEREALVEIGGYKPWPVSADFELWCALSRRGWLGAIDDPLVGWRQHVEQISASRYAEQRGTSLRVVSDHLRRIDAAGFDEGTVDALWALGHWEPVELERGRVALDRWERSWRNDEALDPIDRRELRSLSRRLRLRLMRYSSARTFVGVARTIRGFAGPSGLVRT